VGVALQVEIEIGAKRRWCLGLLVGPHAVVADHAVARIDFDEASSIARPQLLLVLPFETGLAHVLPGAIVVEGGQGEILFRDFARIPDQRRHRLRIGIVPFGRTLNDQSRELDATFLENRHDLERRIVENDRGHLRRTAIAPNGKFLLRRIDRNNLRQRPKRRPQRVFGRTDDGDAVPRQILGDDLAFAIIDDAARAG
jgi:hypothetical protein